MNATTATFPLAFGFKGGGLRCANPVCNRVIAEGQPYSRDLIGVTDDGEPVSWLICVYCTTHDAHLPLPEAGL